MEERVHEEPWLQAKLSCGVGRRGDVHRRPDTDVVILLISIRTIPLLVKAYPIS